MIRISWLSQYISDRHDTCLPCHDIYLPGTIYVWPSTYITCHYPNVFVFRSIYIWQTCNMSAMSRHISARHDIFLAIPIYNLSFWFFLNFGWIYLQYPIYVCHGAIYVCQTRYISDIPDICLTNPIYVWHVTTYICQARYMSVRVTYTY